VNRRNPERLRVGLDLHTLEGMHQGSRTHCAELFSRVVRLLPEMDFFLFADTTRWPQSEKERFCAANARIIPMPHRNPMVRLSRQLPQLSARCRLDLLHTQYVCPLRLHARRAVTIHDILFEQFPQYFESFLRTRSKILFRRTARTADLVFTVSDYSKRELIERYGIEPDHITTIHNAADARRFFPGDRGHADVANRGLVPGSFLLCVGRLEPKKNYLGLLKGYALLPAARPRLVIVGQRDISYEEILQLRTNLRLEREVLLLEDVDDELLPALYRHALAFVYPSLAEGFGMAIIEAMASGTPVITSNSTSLPEIAGGAAILVDCHSPQEICLGIRTVMGNPSVRQQLRKWGLKRASEFSWDNSAQLVAQRYRTILETNHK
jgi:glycosyltransferase involved in cell wall biosynthesis